MRRLDEIMNFNEEFVLNKEYLKYTKIRKDNKKIVIVSCMDTRLTELLPKALNIKDGDAKFIKNAGASVIHPFGNTIRSIVIAIYEFDIDEVYIIAHHDCGMSNLDSSKTLEKGYSKGIDKNEVKKIIDSGFDLEKWLKGFNSLNDSVVSTVKSIKNHPLIPRDIKVYGLIIDPTNGKLELVYDDLWGIHEK